MNFNNNSFVYDAWGNHKIYGASGTEITSGICPFRYRGYFYDVETGLYFLKSRYYDPETGRFISPDGIEYADPETINGLNLYAYCGNNPVMNIDPEGHLFWLFLIGLAIGAASGAISYVGEVLINGIFYGKWSWSWGEFLGSVIGGAIGGAIAFAFPGLGLGISGFISGFTTEVGAMLGTNITGETNYSIGQILMNSFIVGVFAGVSTKVMSKIRIPGVSSGRGSFSAVYNQMQTKLKKELIKHISIKTFSKMLAVDLYKGLFATMLGTAYEKGNVKEWVLGWS